MSTRVPQQAHFKEASKNVPPTTSNITSTPVDNSNMQLNNSMLVRQLSRVATYAFEYHCFQLKYRADHKIVLSMVYPVAIHLPPAEAFFSAAPRAFALSKAAGSTTMSAPASFRILALLSPRATAMTVAPIIFAICVSNSDQSNKENQILNSGLLCPQACIHTH